MAGGDSNDMEGEEVEEHSESVVRGEGSNVL